MCNGFINIGIKTEWEVNCDYGGPDDFCSLKMNIIEDKNSIMSSSTSSYIVFLLSVLCSIGLFWIFKYNTKIKLFKDPSLFLKSLLILILTNGVFWIYFFVRAILFNRIVQNSPSYESYREMDLGGIAEKGVAEYYNTLSPIILSITILAFIFLFITGFIVRKKSKSLIQQQKFKNKPLVLLIIGMSLLLFMMTIFSMIMLVLTSNFKVSYY